MSMAIFKFEYLRSLFLSVLILMFFYCSSMAIELPRSPLEQEFLFVSDKELEVISPTRKPKSISQVAENVTVIMAKDIELMNAHTLADVLYHIPGLQVEFSGGPGATNFTYIQGADPKHVRILIDGVTMNNLDANYANVGFIPVQNIYSIEIIKGPASSTWGSSLGGVINIITKSAFGEEKVGGSVYASHGEWNTGDYRGEAYGSFGKFGDYLSAGRIHSE